MSRVPQVTLLAFDFDGTLAPIENDPRSVRIDPLAAEFLAEVAATPGIVVAVASGRDNDDLAERLEGLPVYLIGSHGLEIRGPEGRTIRESEPLEISFDEDLYRAAASAGFRFERKRHGLSLHWRGLSGVTAAHPILQRFRRWAISRNLDVIEGRCVLEARSRGDGKEEALRWVSSATGAHRVIFAGDDATDFGALRYAAENGLALFMASEERTPPDGVTLVGSCEELVDLLRDEVRI